MAAELGWVELREGVLKSSGARGKWIITPHDGKFNLAFQPRFTRGMLFIGTFDTCSAAKDFADNDEVTSLPL